MFASHLKWVFDLDFFFFLQIQSKRKRDAEVTGLGLYEYDIRVKLSYIFGSKFNSYNIKVHEFMSLTEIVSGLKDV